MKRSRYDGRLGHHFLQMAQDVWWPSSFRVKAPQAGGGRESAPEELVADLSLDKGMIQDVVAKKL